MRYIKILPVILFLTTLTGCEVVGGIFKAGVWSGVIMVVVIIAIILYLISRIRRKS